MNTDDNIMSVILTGRLGNIFYEILTVFEYCKKFNIDFSCIRLPMTHPIYHKDGIKQAHYMFEPNVGRYLDGNSILSILDNFPMFENIKDNFIDGTDWLNMFSQFNCRVGFKSDMQVKNQNIYFREYECTYDPQLIRDIFVNQPIYDKLRDKYDFTNSVAIHIRRGDLLRHVHLCKQVYTKDDIDNAIRIEYENNKNMKLFVFSEDIAWCRENIKFDNIQFIEGNKPYEDVYLMSMCDRIIKNKSSFNHMAIHIKDAMIVR